MLELTITDQNFTEYEKDLGDDDNGCPMIAFKRIDHAVIECSEDVSRQVIDSRVSWANTHLSCSPDSELDEKVVDLLSLNKWSLFGISSVSDDGKTLTVSYRP
jgi:hypothetical protein